VATKRGLTALAVNIQSNMVNEERPISLLMIFPGISVSEKQIEKFTLSQLKFWLKSCRINQRGKIKELLDVYVFHPSIVSISNKMHKNNLFSPFFMPKRTLFMVALEKRI